MIQLTQNSLRLMLAKLESISEAWGDFTQWLSQALHLLANAADDSPLMAEHTRVIKQALASIFEHVIGDSYETPHTKAALKVVHDGREEGE